MIYTPGSDDARAMVEPLRSVMRHWTFRTPTDNECQPTGIIVKNRVWFDFESQPPKLSVSHVDEKKAYAGPTIKVVTRYNPVYPRDMQRRGWQSYVYTRVAVDPQGNVTEVLATAYPKQDGFDLSDFEKESIRALRKWTFNPMPELQRPRFACYEIYYRLRG